MTSVLIIDDSLEDREQFSYLLRNTQPDLDVVACADGMSGVDTARERPFDCALLDLRLDGENGLDVLAGLHEVRPDLPVIVFTGQGSEQAATEAFVAGAAYYLPKSNLTGPALWAATDRVLRQAETERELKAKRQAMERSTRLTALGQLAAGIAHDFNNHLGALRYCLELLKDTAQTTPAQEQVHTALKIIEESANLATRMTALSRQGDLLARDVALRKTLIDLRALASATISDRVRLTVDLPAPDLTVKCDPGQLLNALLNLVLNANDAIELQRGVAGVVEVSVEQDGARVRIKVTDNGSGMSPEVLEKSCDPFFTTKAARNGTGLGLAMVHAFAQDNHGALDLQSTLGTGTEVTLDLPAGVPEADAGAAQPVVAEVPQKPARILLVEDVAFLAHVTQQILERAGFSVKTVEGAEQALDYIQTGREVDVLLTDIRMPQMDGFALATELRRHVDGLRVVYMTGYAPDDFKRDASGPVLQKPVEPDLLIETVRSVLKE